MPWTSVGRYLQSMETMQRRELVYGVVREPPAPAWRHQDVLTRLTVLLDTYVRRRDLGRVCVAPVDVVLDRRKALVVQPDLIFIAKDRLDIVDERVWSAPDLVIEVLSLGTARRDRTVKLGWYQRYGAKECWLVDSVMGQIEVVQFAGRRRTRRIFESTATVRSGVLRGLRLPVRRVFDE